MRIDRLDLLRFGKFTDRAIALPRARQDFHLVVGANEAGKSTLRNAIQELLFGIETRSRYNFLHAYGDMRLGAQISHGDARLEFQRIKARSKTLQSPAGAPLADNALAPFLGTVDRSFFDQMFGLDHDRLVAGGREILKATNDVGRILFQSAAGIGSLGRVRDELEAEAASLWARRRAGDREYYAASDDLAAADAKLKEATVRTRDWVAATTAVADLEAAIDAARARYGSLEDERVRLDRIRRCAPLLAALREAETARAELGPVAPLPADAGPQLDRAAQEIARAGESLRHFRERAAQLAERLAGLPPESALLARSDDIQALAERRQQLRGHPEAIARDREEIKGLDRRLADLARRLGWPAADGDTLAARLPGPLQQSGIAALLRRHDSLVHTRDTARDAHASLEGELQRIDHELQALPAIAASPALQDALSRVRALGDVSATGLLLAAQTERLRREHATARRELGAWPLETEALLALTLPTPDEAGALQQRLAELESSCASLAERLAQTCSEHATLGLQIEHYTAAHGPVSLPELQAARQARDQVWQRIRSGAAPLEATAPDFEARLAAADSLADQRHDKAREASELQSRLDRLAILAQQGQDLEARHGAALAARSTFDTEWAARMAALGLAGLRVFQLASWRSARDAVLRSAGALAEAARDEQDFHARATATLADLQSALGDAADAAPLAPGALVLRAEGVVEGATRSQERREALRTQQGRGQVALADAARKLGQAEAGLSAWQTEWAQAMTTAGLAADTAPAVAENALALFQQMDEALRRREELRTTRIVTLERELADFAREAAALAGDLAAAIDTGPAGQPADAIARVLAEGLAAATDAHRERQRLGRELQEAEQEAELAEARIREARAGLQPLLDMAGAPGQDGLALEIHRAERARGLDAEGARSRLALQEAGDGQPREALEAEASACDPGRIPGLLTELKGRVDEVVATLSRLTGELAAARDQLGRIAGQDQAARAEAQRQEALARMGNAAERYIKVHIATRLLDWAITRYRETRQGPMLARAGTLFAGLTLGAFQRLAVDYEQEPPILHGQRLGGEHVPIEGMSDGTRDQLYLALRLAALEMHLESAPAMPFIADDLVINYDDARARAGLAALGHLSERTQVIFLSHHDHLVPMAREVFGEGLNVVRLD